MTRSLVERLRNFARNGVVALRQDKDEPSAAHTAEEAADEIERLSTELKRSRDARWMRERNGE